MRSASYHVGVDGPQAVAVRNPVGGATAAEGMRAKCGRAGPDEGGGDGNVGRRPGGQRAHFTGR